MKNILLVCAAGMSTSLLVTKMIKAAEKQNIEVNITALPLVEAAEEIGKMDLVMLGPQVRFALKEVEGMTKGRIPSIICDMRMYGTLNGEGLLQQALDAMK